MSKLPLIKFLEDNFPSVLKAWDLSEEDWNRLFAWYISTGNIFQFLRGATVLGFVLFRPMTKEQLGKRHAEFTSDVNGEYLYVPLFVTRKEWKGRGMWNLVKGLASHTYPNLKFIAYESWKSSDQELNIIEIQGKEKKKTNGKQKTRSRPASSSPNS